MHQYDVVQKGSQCEFLGREPRIDAFIKDIGL